MVSHGVRAICIGGGFLSVGGYGDFGFFSSAWEVPVKLPLA
jgi:hypothetical protein